LRSISTCVSTYGFDLLFRLVNTACICHRLCNRESVGFAADRSFSTAFEHCIHRSLSACDRFRFIMQLAISTDDLGLRLPSGLQFRSLRFPGAFDVRLRFLDLAINFAASIRIVSSQAASHFVSSLRSISVAILLCNCIAGYQRISGLHFPWALRFRVYRLRR
jgi:hypothetical protein